ncbi:AAA family ATPase [Streptomyces sp. NPDC002133]|uniref:AAA family ATPase n=1 Tax=Streptomyces sp. NPDC002133 TaxID=3154409 RepID=UPI00332E0488
MGHHLNGRLLHLSVDNYRTLTRVELPLGPLTVLVGPNAAGKSNVLHALEFLGLVTQHGITATLKGLGGYPEIAYRGGDRFTSLMRVGVKGVWGPHGSESQPDSYELTLRYRLRRGKGSNDYVLSRRERLEHRAPDGSSTVLDLKSTKTSVTYPQRPKQVTSKFAVQPQESALHSSAGLPVGHPVDAGLSTLADLLRSIRVFDIDVRAARRPAPIGESAHLMDDGSNIADFLKELREDADAWELFLEDITTVLPHIEDIEILPTPHRPDRVTVAIHERGLRGSTRLADASFGTVRLLCLLALFHDPHSPAMTCIEEIDHGIHPHALELLSHRLREASDRSQFLVTTHSPVFVDQLRPEEFVVCERDEHGRSRIPATSTDQILAAIDASEGMPIGELWFSGTLGGTAW